MGRCCTTPRSDTTDKSVEDAIDDVNVEYLDLLFDLTGDQFIGSQTIER